MDKGEMDAEPEVTMDKRRLHTEAMEWEEESESRSVPGKKEKQREVVLNKVKGVPGDAFFEASDNSEQSDDG